MTTVVAQRSPAAVTPQGYQGPARSAQATEHTASTDIEDTAPVSETETAELETPAEAPREAETATDGGNNVNTEDATAKPEGERETAAPAQPNQNNLIINYLPSHVTEIELRNMFAVHGDLAHVKVVYDRTTGKSMGYGFVKFTTNEAAAAATNAINGMAIDRKRIKVLNRDPLLRTMVSVARPSSKEIKNSKLYVTNLPDHFNQENVVEVFQQYGKIIECRTLVDPKTTISRCTAFVQFDTRREAKDALKFMNGHSLPGAKKGLLVKFAEDHHRRMQRQEQGQNGKGRGGDGNHYGQGHQHQGKGKGGRKGKGGGGRGGGGGGMYRGNQGMGARHGHPPHMGPGYLNHAMGMQASPDGSPMAQTMMGRYGMQLPPGGPAAAAAAQQAAAYNAAQVAHNTYGMMQLNNAMSMMNVAGGNVPGARGDGGAGAAGADGNVGGVGAGGAFGVPPPPPSGLGGGRSSMMRGGAEHVHPPPPPAVLPQMLSPTGYGSAGAGMGYVNDMKNASNLSGGGGPVTPVKHQQPQAGGERGTLEQQQQQQQANNHGQQFVLRGV